MVPVYLWIGVGETHTVGHHSILYSFNRYFLRLYDVPGPVSNSGEKNPNPCPMEFTF